MSAADSVLLVLIACASCVPASAQQRAVPPAAVLCDSCHGVKGEGLPALNAPRLAGLQSWYLEKQLKDFRSGVRGGSGFDSNAALMKRIADSLGGDSAVAEAAGYIASLPPTPAPVPGVAGSAARGESLFATCVACHGKSGEGSEATHAPRLKGANDWYVVRQLEAFKSGRRGADEHDPSGQQMRAIAATISDEQAMQDLAAYVGTLE